MPVWKATTVEVVDGSIVELEVDAIVNAANATLAGAVNSASVARAPDGGRRVTERVTAPLEALDADPR